jgi:acetoin utilization deacetylase AcuC-like enzyme
MDAHMCVFCVCFDHCQSTHFYAYIHTYIHSDEYLDSLFTLFDVVNRGTMPHVVLDPPFHDTIISPGTREAVLFSAGCVTAAVDAVVNGDTRNAFCAVRPPGHHAEVKRAMGFCFLNNVAIGASYAKRIHKMHRVAVVDFDAHHGNGTQEMLGMDADSFLFVSLHRNDVVGAVCVRVCVSVQIRSYVKLLITHTQFPFNATSTFTTVPKNAQNHPVFDRAGFLGAIKHIKESLTAFDPDLIFISAGTWCSVCVYMYECIRAVRVYVIKLPLSLLLLCTHRVRRACGRLPGSLTGPVQ